MATEPITDAELSQAELHLVSMDRMFWRGIWWADALPKLIAAVRAARAENAKLRAVAEAARSVLVRYDKGERVYCPCMDHRSLNISLALRHALEALGDA